jgi:hypothetical protein
MIGLAPETLPTDLRQLASRRPENPVPFVQGFYYVLIGLTPVLAGGGFRAVRGPDADPWVLRSYGLIVAAVGAALLIESRRRNAVAGTGRPAIAVAVVLAAADVVFVATRTAPSVYLIDAAVQAAFVFWWVRVMLMREPEFVGRVGVA